MKTNNNLAVPFSAVHPVEVIKEEIKACSMTQKELACRMGIQASNLSRLLKGERITLSTAQKLETALGIPAENWIRMQAQYDRDVKTIAVRNEKEKSAIADERMLSCVLNLPELYKRLKISSSLYIQEKLEKLEDKLGYPAVDIVNKAFISQVHYKNSEDGASDKKNRATWLALAYISSQKNRPEKAFAPGNAQSAARDIASMVHRGGLKENEIKTILSQHGIAYSVVPGLKRTPIDAVAMQVEGFPAIVTTHRENDMSRLIFNILHELGHIEHHMSSPHPGIFISGDSFLSDPAREKEANAFAQEMLIPKTLWNAMMDSIPGGLRMQNIIRQLKQLSAEHHLDFNIVVWRWKYESRNCLLRDVRPVQIH